MEIFRKYRKLENQINIWGWLAKIGPLIALVIVLLVVAFDFQSLLEYTLGLICILFAIIAGIWWWWVVGTVRHFVRLKKYATSKFAEITKELKSIKVDLAKTRKQRKKEHDKLRK
jgi:Na+/melibiose symporter-like transporter